MRPAIIGLTVVLATGLGAAVPGEGGQRQRQGQAAPRSGGGGDGSGRTHAVPRDGGGSGRSGAREAPRPSPPPQRATAPASGGSTTASGNSGGARRRAPVTAGDSGGTRTAVPAGERSRDNRYATGKAVERQYAPYDAPIYRRRGHGGGGWYDYPSWYYRSSYWYGVGAVGLGYFYYDPFWYGDYPAYGYGYDAYGGYPGYGYGAPAYGGGGQYYGDDAGRVRLKVKPRDAEVYVDGYFVGLVDDFDGTFQKLELAEGAHRIEIRRAGLAPMVVDVRVIPDETITIRGALQP